MDCDNNLYNAIDRILESGDNLDTWTEQKGAKKEKKKDEGSFNSRGFVARGRGDFQLKKKITEILQVVALVLSIEVGAADPTELHARVARTGITAIIGKTGKIVITVTVMKARSSVALASIVGDLRDRTSVEVEEVVAEEDTHVPLLHRPLSSRTHSPMISKR